MSQRTVFPEKITIAQLLIQFIVFYRKCGVITVSTTAWLTLPHLTSSAHLSSVLTYIIHWTTSLLQPICLVHFKHHVDTPKWETKKGIHWQITENLTSPTDLKSAQRHTMKLKPHTSPTLTYIQTKNFVLDDKHKPQAELSVFNWHNQNPNMTTVEMLTVLLQWLCSKVWESEFSDLWQQWVCHCVCSTVYIKAMKIAVHCPLWLSIPDNPVHMPHVTQHCTWPSHSPSFLKSNNISSATV